MSRAREGGAQMEKEANQGPNKLIPSHPSPKESQEPAQLKGSTGSASQQGRGPWGNTAARAGQEETAKGYQGGPGASGGEAGAEPEDRS